MKPFVELENNAMLGGGGDSIINGHEQQLPFIKLAG